MPPLISASSSGLSPAPRPSGFLSKKKRAWFFWTMSIAIWLLIFRPAWCPTPIFASVARFTISWLMNFRIPPPFNGRIWYHWSIMPFPRVEVCYRWRHQAGNLWLPGSGLPDHGWPEKPEKKFNSVEVCVKPLVTNRRSRQAILDFVSSIFPKGIKNLLVSQDNKKMADKIEPWKKAAESSGLDNFECQGVEDKTQGGGDVFPVTWKWSFSAAPKIKK